MLARNTFHCVTAACFVFTIVFQKVFFIFWHLAVIPAVEPVVVLVPGSVRVKDALSDTIPPAPVFRSLFNLVPADANFPKLLVDDSVPVLSRST